MGKSRLSPLKPVSVTRLELTAATIAVKLSTFVCNQLEFEFDYVYYWTDAMIALCYIHNTASRFYTFVANRLRFIQSLTNTKQWLYVPTKRNPADVASRGLMPNKVDTANLWFRGPNFLLNDYEPWPKQPKFNKLLSPDDEEVKKESVVNVLQDSTILGKLLKRFISRRGKPSEIYSDNGINFRGAKRELNQGIEAWNSQNFQANIRQKEIDWKFNTPSCSHAGGICERLIKSVQKHFPLIAGETKLDDFELATLSTEIKRILNDRPITDVSTDPKDLSALTPSTLFNGVVETSLPADLCSKSDLYRRSWRKGQILADRFRSLVSVNTCQCYSHGKSGSAYHLTSMLAT